MSTYPTLLNIILIFIFLTQSLIKTQANKPPTSSIPSSNPSTLASDVSKYPNDLWDVEELELYDIYNRWVKYGEITRE